MTEIEYLKDQIRLTNAILRETHNPREFKQNKKHLERLERKLRKWESSLKHKNPTLPRMACDHLNILQHSILTSVEQ